MKKLIFTFSLISTLAYSQMPNISSVWLNKGNFYSGTMTQSDEKTILKMRINLSEQNKKNDQEYFISGISEKDGVSTNIEGSLKIDKYKDAKKTSKMFGTYEIAEQPNGKTSGLYKGNFIFSFKWDPKTQEITD